MIKKIINPIKLAAVCVFSFNFPTEIFSLHGHNLM